jgi:nucleolar pre-ribosomal-associated protein 1
MAKRAPHLGDSEADGAAAFRKRQKITHEVPAGEDVYSGDQLRKLLSFDQDLHRARHGE